MKCKIIRMNVTQPGVFVSWKRAMYFQFQVHTVKLGFKKLLNKEQLVNSETFPVTNMPFHLMNSEQIVFSEQSYYNQKVLYYQVWLYNCNFLVFFIFVTPTYQNHQISHKDCKILITPSCPNEFMKSLNRPWTTAGAIEQFIVSAKKLNENST